MPTKIIKTKVTGKRNNSPDTSETGYKSKEDAKPQLGNIKDELFLVSFIVLCAGIIFTDAYYQRFGFKYQMLNLSTAHIIYKGLTMVITSPFMLIPYLSAIGFLLFEQYSINNNIKFFTTLRSPLVYLFLILNLIIIYPLAQNVGIKQIMESSSFRAGQL